MAVNYKDSRTIAKIGSMFKTNKVSKARFVNLYVEHSPSCKMKHKTLIASRKHRANRYYNALVKDGVIISVSE